MLTHSFSISFLCFLKFFDCFENLLQQVLTNQKSPTAPHHDLAPEGFLGVAHGACFLALITW